MLLQSSLALLLALLTAAQHITNDTTDTSGNVVIPDDVTIDNNVWWSIYNSNLDFSSSKEIKNLGGFYWFGDNYDGYYWISGGTKLINSGIFYMKSVRASNSIMFFTQQFVNSGDFYVIGVQNKWTLVDIPGENWSNNQGASILMYFDTRPGKGATFGTEHHPITNNGQICMRNYFWTSRSSVHGTGCIDIGENSVFQYQESELFPSDQTLYLSTPTSVVLLGSAKQYYPYMISGFGGGNYITHGSQIDRYEYNADSGLLTVHTRDAGSRQPCTMHYNIGLGYHQSMFKILELVDLGPGIGISPQNSTITYEGKVPEYSTTHNGCVLCKDEPMFPPQ